MERRNIPYIVAVISKLFSPLNLKNKKPYVALALVFIMTASMFFALNMVGAQPATSGTFSTVELGTGGTTNINSVSVPSSPNPIGTTVKFDIYISGAADIWGWAVPTVTWNTAVVHLTKVVAGPFLADNTGGDTVSTTGTSSSLFDNTVNPGSISGGLAQAITAADVSTDPSGVVATLTFTIVGYGSSPITINQGYLLGSAAVGTPKISAPCNSASVAAVQSTVTSISIYQSGSTTNANIQFPSLQDPIGATFSINLYITGAAGVWGWSVDVTWDPNVVKCTSVTEGPYLSQSGKTSFSPGFIDNYLGKVDDGISDEYTSAMSASASSGVLTTLTFQIVTYSDSALGLITGTPTLQNDASPHQAITPVQLNNAAYSWTPAPATGPQAVIIASGGPFGTGSDQTLTDFALILNGSQSMPGINMVPPYQICPITKYSWSITLVDGAVLTSSASAVSLSAAQVGSAPGTIVATLTVTALSPTNTPAPGYSETGTTTLTIQVLQSESALDIWTQNGGQGAGADASAFGPQQLVNLIGYVTFNNAPVVGKEVTFDIYDNGQYIDYAEASTNSTGYATTSYRFPWQGSDPTDYFGVVTVKGTVDLSQVTLNDTCQFYYGYQLNLQGVTINNGVYDTNGVGPVFFPNYAGLNVITLTATVNSTNWTPTPFYLTATVFDTNTVPVAFQILAETAPAATGNLATSSNTQTYTLSLTIPTWAYVGPAYVDVDILNGTPANSGIAFSPQQQAPLYIYYGS